MPRALLAESQMNGLAAPADETDAEVGPDPERRIEDWLVSHLEGGARPGTGKISLDDLAASWSLSLKKGPGRPAVSPKPGRAAAPEGPSWKRLKVSLRGDVTTVRFADPALLREDHLAEAAVELNALIAAGHRRIVLNFAGVDRISSGIVGALASAYRRCEERKGGQLRVCNLRNGLEAVLALTGLEGLIVHFADEAAALAAPWPSDGGPQPLPVAILTALSSRGIPAGDGARLPAPAVAPARRDEADGVWLVVLSGRTKGRVIAVRDDLFVIGRSSESDLRVDVPTVSRRHAVLERQGATVRVRDLNTANGTTHNGRLLRNGEATVADGDRLQIGPFRAAVVLGHRPDGHLPADDEIVGWLRDDEGDDDGPTTLHEIPKVDGEDDRPFKWEIVEGILVVTPLVADLDVETAVAPLRDGLNALLDGGQTLPRRVVLNLDRVCSLSSRAVGMIVAHSLRLEHQGGGLRLCRASAPVLALLQHLKLPMLLGVHHELDDAVLMAWDGE